MHRRSAEAREAEGEKRFANGVKHDQLLPHTQGACAVELAQKCPNLLHLSIDERASCVGGTSLLQASFSSMQWTRELRMFRLHVADLLQSVKYRCLHRFVWQGLSIVYFPLGNLPQDHADTQSQGI